MQPSSFGRRSRFGATILLGGVAWLASAPAPAQDRPAGNDANHAFVLLIRQDVSDCTNGNVDAENPEVGGEVLVVRNRDGTTHVKATMNAAPNTTYHFYLKCVREIGTITTGDEGIGTGEFSFPTDSTGAVYAFDVYPQGAPAGNKFQSVRVSFQ